MAGAWIRTRRKLALLQNFTFKRPVGRGMETIIELQAGEELYQTGKNPVINKIQCLVLNCLMIWVPYDIIEITWVPYEPEK